MKRPTRAQREADPSVRLQGYLYDIEMHARNFAAWWEQEGKEALASSDLAWVDETVAFTEEKLAMILDSVRGRGADEDMEGIA